MDRTQACGACDRGSIPLEGTIQNLVGKFSPRKFGKAAEPHESKPQNNLEKNIGSNHILILGEENFLIHLMKQISTQYANKIIATTASLLAIFTLTVLFWNRTSHNTVSISTPDEKNTAFIIFVITLLALYSIPLIVSLFTEKSENNKKWPIFEACTVVIGILIFVIFVSIPDLVPYPLNQDIVGSFLAYTAIVIAYSFMIKRLDNCWREQYRGGVLVNAIGVLIVGLIIFATSWIMIYFE